MSFNEKENALADCRGCTVIGLTNASRMPHVFVNEIAAIPISLAHRR